MVAGSGRLVGCAPAVGVDDPELVTRPRRKAMPAPSGDQAGKDVRRLAVGELPRLAVGATVLRAGRSRRARRPERAETKARRVPSGERAGWKSCGRPSATLRRGAAGDGRSQMSRWPARARKKAIHRPSGEIVRRGGGHRPRQTSAGASAVRTPPSRRGWSHRSVAPSRGSEAKTTALPSGQAAGVSSVGAARDPVDGSPARRSTTRMSLSDDRSM